MFDKVENMVNVDRVFCEYPDTIYDLPHLTYGHVCSRWPCLFKVAMFV